MNPSRTGRREWPDLGDMRYPGHKERPELVAGARVKRQLAKLVVNFASWEKKKRELQRDKRNDDTKRYFMARERGGHVCADQYSPQTIRTSFILFH